MSEQEGLRRTPLYEQHIALGGRMVGFAGWEMPVQYAGIVEEHHAVRRQAGVFDVCHMAELRVFGPGAGEALQSLLTNDVRRLAEVGQAQYTLLCDEDGGIVDDLILYRSGDLEYLIIANAGSREAVVAWFAERLPGSVEFADESDRTGLIALQGPEAVRIYEELSCGIPVPPRFTIGEGRVGEVPVLVSRTGYTGEDGVEVLCAAAHAAGIWRAMLSFPEVAPCGLGARDTLRMEMGYHLYGSDMDRSTDAVSAGLKWVVAFDKGDFTGREALARVAEAGPERRLAWLEVAPGEGVPRHGYPVLRDDVTVGYVASGTFSPTLGRGIASAYVPAETAREGAELAIGIRKRTAQARVVRPPFVKATSLKR